MTEIMLTVMILLSAYLLNDATSRTDPTYRGYRNSIAISFVLFCVWLALDYWFVPGSWWRLSSSSFVEVILLTLATMMANIFLYRWYMTGTDYPGLVRAGVVSDGCPYLGSYAIPKNFITHGGTTLWEEIVFRGLIGVGLFILFGSVISIVVTALLFGLLHYLPFRAYAKHHSIRPDRYVLGALISPTLFPSCYIHGR
ncbi:CPBP family intramembrane glutamic endopeptidase [Meiothermus sp.]|uniref:CPBP family intramembrane glutamic endopeptidase n=1 Tax=Meiothermus sp. TaxID=1955249 RepID=UPI0021DDECE6|nr:CPBP family intramembrane glutamic endopeptidase [Meiothermus sp.]GIW33373.1 MAG: hypothetical protein KatS3mg072_0706 [Meiothermus sp.]